MVPLHAFQHHQATMFQAAMPHHKLSVKLVNIHSLEHPHAPRHVLLVRTTYSKQYAPKYIQATIQKQETPYHAPEERSPAWQGLAYVKVVL